MRYQDLPPTRYVLVPDEYEDTIPDAPPGVYMYIGQDDPYSTVARIYHPGRFTVHTVGARTLVAMQPWPPAPENRGPETGIVGTEPNPEAYHIAADRDGKLTWTRRSEMAAPELPPFYLHVVVPSEHNYVSWDREVSVGNSTSSPVHVTTNVPEITYDRFDVGVYRINGVTVENRTKAPVYVTHPYVPAVIDEYKPAPDEDDDEQDDDAELSYDEWSRQHSWGRK